MGAWKEKGFFGCMGSNHPYWWSWDWHQSQAFSQWSSLVVVRCFFVFLFPKFKTPRGQKVQGISLCDVTICKGSAPIHGAFAEIKWNPLITLHNQLVLLTDHLNQLFAWVINESWSNSSHEWRMILLRWWGAQATHATGVWFQQIGSKILPVVSPILNIAHQVRSDRKAAR